jgi:hypothetical protein
MKRPFDKLLRFFNSAFVAFLARESFIYIYIYIYQPVVLGL